MRVTRTVGIAVAAALVAALAAPGTAFANDSAMGGAGGAVTPIGNSDIRMAAETVQVLVYQQFAEYRIDFRFENSGAPQTIELGFPFPLPYEGEENNTPAAAFRAWQGGKPLAVTYQEVLAKSGARTAYYLHEAEFPTGATMIRVSYYALHDSTAGSPPAGATPPERYKSAFSYWGSYPYTVSTGAGWAGTIGKSIIRYYVSSDAQAWGIESAISEQAKMLTGNTEAPAGSAKTLTSYTVPAKDVYQWIFTDFEPTPDANGRSPFDIELSFYVPGGAGEGAEPWMPVADVRASSELRLDGFEYPGSNAADGDPSTAWAEAAKGSGAGESLQVLFPLRRRVGEIRVLPGYAKTEALFRKYNRPKVLDVEFSDGTRTSLSLADEPSVQRFPVSVEADWAKLTIVDVYRGTTRDETYLSEVEFADVWDAKMLTFETVMAGGLTEASDEPTDRPQPDANGQDRNPVPAWFQGPGGPLRLGCVGFGILLGLLIGGTLVLVQRRAMARRAAAEQAPAAPGSAPPAPPPPAL
jgi:hypothetical protein